MALPLGLDMISQGRVDVLLVVADCRSSFDGSSS